MTTVSKRWPFLARQTAPYLSKAAFSRLYEHTHIKVFRYVYGLMGGSRQDAEDITAQTYLKAWSARQQFSGTQEQAQGWLFTIAKRIVIDRHRRQSVRPKPVDLDEDFLVSRDASPEEKTITAEQVYKLWSLLDNLSSENQEIIVLRYMVGLPIKDIAAQMNMKPNTISVRLKRMLMQLEGQWQQESQER